MNPLFFFFFVTETYNAITHALVLFRIRLLPRKDFVHLRFYFLCELSSAVLTSFFVLQKFRPLVCLHALLHLYYFFTWDKSRATKRVLNWVSIDWIQSKYNATYELGYILGTVFDWGIHVLFAYLLFQSITQVEVILGISICLAVAYFVFFSSRYAWSNPYKVPAWVNKRVQPVDHLEKAQ